MSVMLQDAPAAASSADWATRAEAAGSLVSWAGDDQADAALLRLLDDPDNTAPVAAAACPRWVVTASDGAASLMCRSTAVPPTRITGVRGHHGQRSPQGDGPPGETCVAVVGFGGPPARPFGGWDGCERTVGGIR